MPEQHTPKTLIVTGTSGNLGKAVVTTFLQHGYTVWGTVHHGSAATAIQLQDGLTVRPVDLLSADAAAAFVAEVLQARQSIDAAVLTVGGFAMGNIAGTTADDLLQQYRLNVLTTYNMAQPIFRHMLRQGYGRIYIIGSKAGLDAAYGKGVVAYGMAKAQLFRLAQLMNEEAKGTNVVTSLVVPGTIDTPQNRAAMPGADKSKWVAPERIANIILFYCSDAAKDIREPVIKVYGNG